MKANTDLPSSSPKKHGLSNILMKNRFVRPGVQDYAAVGNKFEITDEQTIWYTRMLFNDEVPSLKRLTAEAKRACQFIGLNPVSLLKNDMEEI